MFSYKRIQTGKSVQFDQLERDQAALREKLSQRHFGIPPCNRDLTAPTKKRRCPSRWQQRPSCAGTATAFPPPAANLRDTGRRRTRSKGAGTGAATALPPATEGTA